MGLNPFREQQRSTADIIIVVCAVALTIGVVLWALMGS
jgi:hypothetical protein